MDNNYVNLEKLAGLEKDAETIIHWKKLCFGNKIQDQKEKEGKRKLKKLT